jgi:addiction module HigA family antidote
MTMHNPPHPGEFIKETYLDPFNISQNEIADKLEVAHSTFNRLVRGNSNVSAEMAVRLSKVLGRTPESWLAMQSNYDLFTLQRKTKWKSLKPFSFPELKPIYS